MIKPVQVIDYVEYHQQLDKLIKEAQNTNNYIDIELTYVGESFQFSSAKETYDKLKELQAIGYYVTEYALTELEEETR